MNGEKCSFNCCNNTELALGLCSGHYKQNHYGKILKPLRPKKPNNTMVDLCIVENCFEPTIAKNACQYHYDMGRRHIKKKQYEERSNSKQPAQ